MIRRTASVNADPTESGAVSRNACAVRSCRATSDVRSVALHLPGRAPEYHDLCFAHREEARAEGLLTPPPLVKLAVGGGAPKGAESSTKAQRVPQGARLAGKRNAVAAPAAVATPAPAADPVLPSTPAPARTPVPAVCPWPACKSVPTGRGLCSTHLSRAQNLQRPLPFPDTVEGVIEQIPVWLDLWNGRLSAGPPPAVFITTPKEHWARQPRPVQAEPEPMPTITPAPKLAPEAPEADPTPTQAAPEAPAPVEAPVEAHQEINEPAVEQDADDAEADDADEAPTAPTPVDAARPKPAAPTKGKKEPKKEPKGQKAPTRQRKRRGDKPPCLWGCGSPAKTCGLCDRDAARIKSLTGTSPSLVPDLATRIEDYKAEWERAQADRRAVASAAIRQRHADLRAQEAAAAAQAEAQPQAGQEAAEVQPEAPQEAAPPAQVEGAAPTSQAVEVVDAELGAPFLLLDLGEGASEPQPQAEAPASAPTEDSPAVSDDRPSPRYRLIGNEDAIARGLDYPVTGLIDAPQALAGTPALWGKADAPDLQTWVSTPGSAADTILMSDDPLSPLDEDTGEPQIQAPQIVTDTVAPTKPDPEKPSPADPADSANIRLYMRAICARLGFNIAPAHMTGMLAMLERAVLDARHQAERAELQAEERIIEALSRGLFADTERRREAVRWLALRTIPTPAGKADLVALLELAVSLPQSTPYLVRALVRSAGGGTHGA